MKNLKKINHFSGLSPIFKLTFPVWGSDLSVEIVRLFSVFLLELGVVKATLAIIYFIVSPSIAIPTYFPPGLNPENDELAFPLMSLVVFCDLKYLGVWVGSVTPTSKVILELNPSPLAFKVTDVDFNAVVVNVVSAKL